jgi:cell wall-associated NlpC family hydrolase
MSRLLILLILIGCQNNINIDNVIDDVSKIHAPDKRISLFNIRYTVDNNTINLLGETSKINAKYDLLIKLDSLGILYQDNIKVLPEVNVYGIINNSVGNLRGKPSHSSELVSQTLLGTSVKVLKKEEEWYLIQTPDEYISWIDHGGITIMDEEDYKSYYKNSYVFSSNQGFAYNSINKESIISDLVVGSILNVIDTKRDFYKIEYPDKRIGWVHKNNIAPIFDSNDYTELDLIENSKKFIGIPYLWGGTSSKGFDCSGFTKTIYLMNGLVLPRDASQQINEGLLVDYERNWDSLKEGDLMFFGYYRDGRRRIDHVAIWIGDGKFIQASKNVRINSVYSDDPLYDKYHMEKYMESRRIIGHETSGVKKL